MRLPSALRARLALGALLGSLLIPVLASSPRGLTHPLTCFRNAGIPFTIVQRVGKTSLLSSAVSGAEGPVCGALRADLRASSNPPRLRVGLENESRQPWQGSVALLIAGREVTFPVGRIEAGETLMLNINLTLEEGIHEVDGTVLVGPGA
jgi:hypothetical protein